MAQRSNVPKFGNWENEENVPYTAYFDQARKGKSGGKMNPNDPQENPSMFSDNTLPVGSPPFQREAEPGSQKGPEAVRSKHERGMSREDGDLRGLTESPLRHDTVGRRATADLPHHQRHGGVRSGSSKSEPERSPLHPHYQARVGGKGRGVSSPSWERKGSSEGSHGLAPSTPGRSRLKSVTRGDETPDHSAAVPKFGDWDESNPASADGYTHIFNRVREEKQSAAGKVPVMATETSYSNGQKQYGNDNSKSCCCFPWGGK